MQRVTTAPEDGATLEGIFADRPFKEVEFVPSEDLRLYSQLAVAVWDTLSLAEVKAQQVRLFETGLVVKASGGSYHHIVVRGPNGEERKAWTRR
jgi:hypothetical protein